MTIIDDINFVERTLAGDTEAFSALVERYRSMVFSIIVRIVPRQQDAEDIAQDVFVKAFSSLTRFRGEARFSTWLCRIAYTTAVSHSRRQRPDRAGSEIDEQYAEPDDADGLIDERLQILRRLLNQMPPEDATLVSLHYRYGKQIEEVAAITGLSAANVKVRLHRIRKKLYQEINEIENG
ncbi:MAG: RNA polymerase sigma factor [Bacteroidales bacterium]|jgi:RNA polymerase sigma-70 factor (ECF subfamily)|nr:RNA polymerase sigma factor [Bacteroidales bacterium]